MQTVGDRVQETSETSGTGTLDLEGAVAGHRTFVAEIGDGNTCHYLIEHRNGSEWELGIGTVTDAPTDTLSRDTVLKSSNGEAKVDLSGGTKDVACTMPSGRAVLTDIKPTFSVDVDLGSNSLLNASIAAPLIDSGTLPDARIQESGVTQHEAALSIAESQIPDGSLLARLADAETVTGAWTFDPGPVVIGTDPGGTEILRVGGSVKIKNQLLVMGSDGDDTFTGNGQIAFKASNDSPLFSYHTQTGSRIGYLQMQASGAARLNVGIAQDLEFYTNDTKRVTIKSDGKVGIGTPSPASPLHVAQGSTSSRDPLMEFETGDNRPLTLVQPSGSVAPFVWGTNNSIAWEVDGNQALEVHSSGNVAVGDVTPGFLLTVEGGTYTHLGAPASGPTTGDMDNGSVIFSVDETNNELDVTVKYSDGTVKTGTVSLS